MHMAFVLIVAALATQQTLSVRKDVGETTSESFDKSTRQVTRHVQLLDTGCSKECKDNHDCIAKRDECGSCKECLAYYTTDEYYLEVIRRRVTPPKKHCPAKCKSNSDCIDCRDECGSCGMCTKYYVSDEYYSDIVIKQVVPSPGKCSKNRCPARCKSNRDCVNCQEECASCEMCNKYYQSDEYYTEIVIKNVVPSKCPDGKDVSPPKMGNTRQQPQVSSWDEDDTVIDENEEGKASHVVDVLQMNGLMAGRNDPNQMGPRCGTGPFLKDCMIMPKLGQSSDWWTLVKDMSDKLEEEGKSCWGQFLVLQLDENPDHIIAIEEQHSRNMESEHTYLRRHKKSETGVEDDEYVDAEGQVRIERPHGARAVKVELQHGAITNTLDATAANRNLQIRLHGGDGSNVDIGESIELILRPKEDVVEFERKEIKYNGDGHENQDGGAIRTNLHKLLATFGQRGKDATQKIDEQFPIGARDVSRDRESQSGQLSYLSRFCLQ